MPRYSFNIHIDAPRPDLAISLHEVIKRNIDSSGDPSPDGLQVIVGDLSASERDDQIRALAAKHHCDGDLEFDEGCVVSEGDDNGAYVQAWAWVGFAGTPLDTEAQEEETE